jgi:ankyrin repeat protein
MKHLLSAVFIAFCFTTATAQETLREIFENDNAPLLDAYLEKAEVNECIFILNSNYSLIALAIKFNATSVFKDLVFKRSADLDKACEDKTPLMYAAKYDRLDMVKTLLDKGANYKVKSKKNRTAYDYALKYEHKSIADLLNGFKR